MRKVCFGKQASFVLDPRRFGTACTTRRAGKTTGIAGKLLHVARTKAGGVALYITKSRKNAKAIFWGILKQMNMDFELGGLESESELSIKLTNGSVIYLSGCVHEGEIENFRGLPISIVILDEAQSLPQFIKRLVDEVLAPALMDFNGQLWLVGTPGPVPVGYFHECVSNPKWAHHQWSVFDNPFIQKKSGKSPQALLDEELERRGVTADEPSIQREWFGRWVLDSNALVFRFDATRNGRIAPRTEHHVICIDLGFDDADALGVLGWNDDSPNLYLVREKVMAKQTLTPLMEQVQALYDEFQPWAVVCDMGGLGKKLALEIQERTGIPIEAAEKERKLEHIELLNDAMRTGRFFAPADSRFAQDCMKVEWDRTNPEKPKISERFHSDICDAVLYGWRKCQQWLYEAPKAQPAKYGTPEFVVEQQQREQQQIEAAWQQQMDANLKQKLEQQEADSWL